MVVSRFGAEAEIQVTQKEPHKDVVQKSSQAIGGRTVGWPTQVNGRDSVLGAEKAKYLTLCVSTTME